MKRFLLISALVVAILVGLVQMLDFYGRPVLNPTASELTPASFARHPIYPNSVLPGGVWTLAALRNPAISFALDGLDVSRAKFENLRATTCAFVSFKNRNGFVRWTRKCVMIPKGELILTDGKVSFRARCGNKISPTPEVPVQDSDVDMDIPLPDIPPEQVPTLTSDVNGLLTSPDVDTLTPVSGSPVIPIVPVVCCGLPVTPVIPPVKADAGDNAFVEVWAVFVLVAVVSLYRCGV